MFLKRTHQPELVLSAAPPAPDPSVRRQGSAETLNLIAKSVAEAAGTARQETEADKPDNFAAGQLMALGHIMSCIERERDLLHQQLMNEAGLHASAGATQWDEELRLLASLPVTSEELFRLAMDYRKVEDEEVEEEAAGVGEGDAAEAEMAIETTENHETAAAAPEHVASA